MNNLKNQHLPLQRSSKGQCRSIGFLAAGILSLSLAASVARAEGLFYGRVESYGGGELVVKTTKHSTGHWTVTPETRVTGSIRRGDWVAVELGAGGHIKDLRLEEHPAGRAGVIKKIQGKVLTVHSGPNMETWNLTDETLMDGVAASDLAVGDEIGAKLYKNHNLAEIRLVKKGVK